MYWVILSTSKLGDAAFVCGTILGPLQLAVHPLGIQLPKFGIVKQLLGQPGQTLPVQLACHLHAASTPISVQECM